MNNYEFPRIRDLPVSERQTFSTWLIGQTRPWIEGVVEEEQDAYFPWDYDRWKEGKPIID